MKLFITVVCLSVAVCSAEDVSPVCKDNCDHMCVAGLTNCLDVVDGTCTKLDSACKQPCYFQCTCTNSCWDECDAEQAACEGGASGGIAVKVCKGKASLCKAACSPKCSIEGIIASRPFETVKAEISKLLPEGEFIY